jgi:hypothetical protein
MVDGKTLSRRYGKGSATRGIIRFRVALPGTPAGLFFSPKGIEPSIEKSVTCGNTIYVVLSVKYLKVL